MENPVNPNSPEFDKKNAWHWLGFINTILKFVFNLFKTK